MKRLKMQMAIAVPLICLLSISQSNAQDWTDATTPLLGDLGQGAGVAWGDYDNDGDLDIYLANYDRANKLFRNEGGGIFADATTPLLGDDEQGFGVAWGDYDNDGDLDIYLSNWGSANKLFRNEGGGIFADATTPLLGDVGQGVSVAWGDYDNDGDLDIYLVNYGDANKLFRNEGVAGFVDATTPLLGDEGHGGGVAWGDYDNDGDLDIYLANSGSSNKLFRNEGVAGFVDATTSPIDDAGALGRGVAWGDYDNDGDLDIYLANYISANKLFRNEGVLGFVDATTPLLGNVGQGLGVAWGDYDNDGDLDIYLANSAVSPDFPRANKLFRNDDDSGNHWLHVELVDTYGGRGGIGARVRLFAGGISQIREVSGGSGYCSQNSLTVEFGLGSIDFVDSLIVYWPSGLMHRVYSAIPVDQFFTVEEGVTSVEVESPTPANFSLGQNIPNPFNPSTVIGFNLPVDRFVKLAVFTVDGRLAAELISEQMPAGQHTITWNGRDGRGREVPSGVYFYRLKSGEYQETKRMTLVR